MDNSKRIAVLEKSVKHWKALAKDNVRRKRVKDSLLRQANAELKELRGGEPAIQYGREQHQHICHLEMLLKTLIKENPNTAGAIIAKSYLEEEAEYHQNFQSWATSRK